MNIIKGCRADDTRRLVAVTFYNAVIVTKNHVRYVSGRYIVRKL